MINTTAMAFVGFISLFLMALLLVIGIIVMAIRRRDHGRAASIGILGCVVLLLGTIFNALQGFLVDLLSPLLDITFAYIVTIVINSVVGLAGTALLIFAVIARRTPPQPAQPQHGPAWQQPQQPQQQADWGQPPQPPFQQQPPGWQEPPRPPFGDGQQ